MKSFKLNVTYLVSANFFSQAMKVVSLPLLILCYKPEDFGRFAIFFSVGMILSVLSTGRYEQAIYKPNTEKQAIEVFKLSIYLSFISFLLFSTIGIFVYLFFIGNNINYILYIPFLTLLISLNNIYVAWLTKINEFKAISINRLGITLINTIISLLLGGIIFVDNGLIIAYFIAIISMNYYLYQTIHKNKRIKIFSQNITRLKILVYRYRSFPKYLMGSGIINTSSIHIPPVLIGFLYGEAVTGIFSIAHRVAFLPTVLISQSISQAFLQRLSMIKGNRSEISKLSSNLFKKLFIYSLFPFLLAATISPYFVESFLDEHWKATSDYILLMLIWSYAVFILSPFSHVFQFINKNNTLFKINLLFFILRVLAVCIGYFLFFSPFISILLYTLASLCLWIVIYIYIYRLRIIQFSWQFNNGIT